MANQQDMNKKGFASQDQSKSQKGGMQPGMSSDQTRKQGQNVNLDDQANRSTVNNRQQETMQSPNRTGDGETSITSDETQSGPTGPASV